MSRRDKGPAAKTTREVYDVTAEHTAYDRGVARGESRGYWRGYDDGADEALRAVVRLVWHGGMTLVGIAALRVVWRDLRGKR